ncbi:MAG: hypothetical protein J4G00_09690, partial [Actinomycetia bacterium]|nr:hypothetical protein [Actinomycetes bacterium]
ALQTSDVRPMLSQGNTAQTDIAEQYRKSTAALSTFPHKSLTDHCGPTRVQRRSAITGMDS